MSAFRDFNENFAASPQINLEQVKTAAAQGFKAVICNRPDNEDGGQIAASDIAVACAAEGLSFTHIPFVGAMTEDDVNAMRAALHAATGPVLAYCRSGTRSSNIWAITQAMDGADVDAIVTMGQNAGYDLNGLRPVLAARSAKAS